MKNQGQAELLASVIMEVQGVLNQGQKKNQMIPPQFQTKKEVKTILVDEPFYMKNGGEDMAMITQGAARNVPVSLKIIKRFGGKAITLERYRARTSEYISLRSIVKNNGKEVLGLREVENKTFTTNEEAVKIVMDLIQKL